MVVNLPALWQAIASFTQFSLAHEGLLIPIFFLTLIEVKMFLKYCDRFNLDAAVPTNQRFNRWLVPHSKKSKERVSI